MGRIAGLGEWVTEHGFADFQSRRPPTFFVTPICSDAGVTVSLQLGLPRRQPGVRIERAFDICLKRG